MLVKLQRDWFAPDGTFHQVSRTPVIELPDDYDLGPERELKEEGAVRKDKDGKPIKGYTNLPSGAVILSKKGHLPSPSIEAKPGFQAKPENEQKLDLIPVAGPTDTLQHTDPAVPTEDDKKKADEAVKAIEDAEKSDAGKTVSQKATETLSKKA